MERSMKVLVTGAAGMLGSGLVPAFVRAGHDVTATDINLTSPQPWGLSGPRVVRLDVRVRDEIQDAVRELKPDLICHLAAETSLEYSDAHEEHAYATNTLGTKFVALEAGQSDTPLVYISTAGVFDGLKEGPYHEWDAANPLNVYGKSKYEGELFVERFAPRSYIVRAGWMVGGGAKDHKFVAKIVGQLRAGRTTIYAVGDKLGTPTYVPDFARTLVALLPTESWGRYHMACEGLGSRFDVAAEIIDILGRTGEVELVEVGSDFFADDYPSVRPRSEIMRNLHLELQGLNTMRPWPVALAEYLHTEVATLGDGVRNTSSIDLVDLSDSERHAVAPHEEAVS
jgi:dTDP-4-dehydrorhamnose reductase